MFRILIFSVLLLAISGNVNDRVTENGVRKVVVGESMILDCPTTHSFPQFFKLVDGAKVILTNSPALKQQSSLHFPQQQLTNHLQQSNNQHPTNIPSHSKQPHVIYDKEARLKIDKLVLEDAGDYGCSVDGVDRVIASVLVEEAARVVLFEKMVGKVEESVVLVCVVEAAHHVIINSSTHPSTHHNRGKLQRYNQTTYHYHIEQLLPQDNDLYNCIASNHISQHVVNATLTVLHPPIITQTSTLRHAWLKHTTNFSCPFLSQPPPIVTWTCGKDARLIHNNNTFHIFQTNKSTTLQVSVNLEDQAWIYTTYNCILSNPLGTTQQTFTLHRATTPDVPSLTLKKVTATWVKLYVGVPMETGGLPVLDFELQWQGGRVSFDLSAEGNGGEVRVGGLLGGQRYMMAVRARNRVGLGVPLQISFKTSRIETPHIEIERASSSTHPFHHTISWKVLSDGGSNVTHYQVFVRQLTPPFSNTETSQHTYPDHTWTRFDTAGTNQTYRVGELDGGGAYEVVMRARNEVGWSSYTLPHFFTTRLATPEEQEAHMKHHLSLLLTVIIFFLLLLLSIIIITALLCRHRWLPRQWPTKTDKQSFGGRSHCSINSNNTTPLHQSTSTTPIPPHHSLSPTPPHHSNSTLPTRISNSTTPFPKSRSNNSTPTSAQQPISHHPLLHNLFPHHSNPRPSHHSQPHHSSSPHHSQPQHSSPHHSQPHHSSSPHHSQPHHSSSPHHSQPHQSSSHRSSPHHLPSKHPSNSNHSSPRHSNSHHQKNLLSQHPSNHHLTSCIIPPHTNVPLPEIPHPNKLISKNLISNKPAPTKPPSNKSTSIKPPSTKPPSIKQPPNIPIPQIPTHSNRSLPAPPSNHHLNSSTHSHHKPTQHTSHIQTTSTTHHTTTSTTHHSINTPLPPIPATS